MEKSRKCYRIGDITFAVILPENYEDKNPYAMFLEENEAESVQYRYQYVGQLPEIQGKIVSKQEFQEVYQHEGRTFHYLFRRDSQDPYACTCFEQNQDTIDVFLTKASPKIWGGLIFQTVAMEHMLAKHGRIILHASYIDVQGKAILFTAPCETGKSTQAELWRKNRGAEIINGDRVCISCDERAFAHGIPMSGTSGICKNKTLPLYAIVYLEQGKENIVERLNGVQAIRAIYSGCWVNTWEIKDVENVLNVIERISSKVPVYKLRCVPNVTAVESLEREIFK